MNKLNEIIGRCLNRVAFSLLHQDPEVSVRGSIVGAVREALELAATLVDEIEPEKTLRALAAELEEPKL